MTDKASDFINSWTMRGNLCSPGADRAVVDGVAGAAHGILNMVGLGFLVDPVGPLQRQLAENQAKLQGMYNSASLGFMKAQEQINEYLMDVMQTNHDEMVAFIQLHDELINENITKVDIALVFTGIMTLLITFYILIFT